LRHVATWVGFAADVITVGTVTAAALKLLGVYRARSTIPRAAHRSPENEKTPPDAGFPSVPLRGFEPRFPP
jgi:hypothetical protein